MEDLARRIKEANRRVYNGMSPEKYNENESIFNESRKKACLEALRKAAGRSGDDRFLDVATGTGNLLRLSEGVFEKRFAIDIGDKLLLAIKDDFPNAGLAAADAEQLPFKDEAFNCVSCHAMLHHLLEHETLFRECFRVLRAGGTLYTDHDPNYFLNRFHHLWYRFKHRGSPGFGSEIDELAEYHNTKSPGINPEVLRKLLLDIGFSQVEIFYWVTERKHWKGAMAFAVPTLRILSRLVPLKSFFTHFSITAVK